MTALHLVYSPEALEACLTRIGQGDAVLLLCDVAGLNFIELSCSGFYALLVDENGDGITKLCHSPLNQKGARGNLDAESKTSSAVEWVNAGHPPIQMIDYSEMVELTLRHHPIVTWT